VFGRIFNYHNLSIEDRTKHCFKNKSTLLVNRTHGIYSKYILQKVILTTRATIFGNNPQNDKNLNNLYVLSNKAVGPGKRNSKLINVGPTSIPEAKVWAIRTNYVST
jgi:hypothetical protein